MPDYFAIIDIIPKKKSDYCVIKLDNSIEILIHNDIIYKHGLNKNQTLSNEEYNKIINEQNLIDAKKIAYSYVSFKRRTEQQIRKKLREKKFDSLTINKTIEFLKEFKLLDDYQFAKQFAKELVERKKIGKIKLIQELKSRGINVDIANEIVNKTFENINVIDLAIKSTEKKLKILKNKLPEKRKQLLVQHLQRQGFDWDTINQILEQYQNNF